MLLSLDRLAIVCHDFGWGLCSERHETRRIPCLVTG